MEIVRNLLTDGLNELEIEPSDSLVHHFEIYLHELKRWNRAYNLTALESNEDIIKKHFFDSLLYLTFISGEGLSICDAGSGAGFPGVPIALARPDLAVTLVESSRKKCAFLRNIRKTLSMGNVDVLEMRFEDVSERFFDIAVTRALFSSRDFISNAGRLIKKGGFLVLSKGPKAEEELKALPPGTIFEVKTVAVPFTSLQRNIIKIMMV